MAAHTSSPNGLVPVHVAVYDPAPMEEEPDPQAVDYAPKLVAASAKYAGISWTKHGAEPRWLDTDTGTCAAAINPSFSGRGADEFDRFLSGADLRGEPGLIIATMGTADDDDDRGWSVFGRPGGRVDFRHFSGAIVGERLLAEAEVSLAPGLNATDRDLGLRSRISTERDHLISAGQAWCRPG